MAKAKERDLSRIGWLDYVLMSIGSCFAVYSAGMSIGEPAISYFSIVLVIVGALFSYFIRISTINSAWIKFDGFLYATCVICALYFASDLASLMPDNGYPREMIAAGWLSWMLILGSFATWQDSTLLFQAIPAFALFGYVGCYEETNRSVTFCFFVFLICLATLFARAHGRQMLRQAALSGYFTRGLAPGSPIPSVETTPGLALKLKQGPWRWVAGPEWALLSSLCVVLISLIGAPVIQSSVSSVAGMVKLPPPPVRNQITAPTTSGDLSGGVVRIGRGPNHASSRPVLRVVLDKARYLREQVFSTYTGHGWQIPVVTFGTASSTQDTPNDIATLQLKNWVSFSFEVDLLQDMRYVPLPPEAILPTPNPTGTFDSHDGAWELTGTGTGQMEVVTGSSKEPSPNVVPKEAFKSPLLSTLLDTAHIPARVAKLALDVSRESKSDFDKATAIEQEIANRIVYNLDSEPSPPDLDPVENALFVTHEAYCDIYASAMVMMARSIGIPARYCQGYLPDERRLQRKGVYIVSNQDYHAWAELMFKDVGWVVFDPTVFAKAVDGEGLGDAGHPPPWYSGITFAHVLDAGIGFVFLALVWLSVRHVKRIRALRDPGSEVGRVYLTFVAKLFSISGRRRRIGQTADEYLETLREPLGAYFESAKALNDRFVAMFYSPAMVSAAAMQELKSDVRGWERAQRTAAKDLKGAIK